MVSDSCVHPFSLNPLVLISPLAQTDLYLVSLSTDFDALSHTGSPHRHTPCVQVRDGQDPDPGIPGFDRMTQAHPVSGILQSGENPDGFEAGGSGKNPDPVHIRAQNTGFR